MKDGGEHSGFTWHPTKEEADEWIKAAEEHGLIGDHPRVYDVPLTRKAILELLNRLADHPDNGGGIYVGQQLKSQIL